MGGLGIGILIANQVNSCNLTNVLLPEWPQNTTGTIHNLEESLPIKVDAVAGATEGGWRQLHINIYGSEMKCPTNSEV